MQKGAVCVLVGMVNMVPGKEAAGSSEGTATRALQVRGSRDHRAEAGALGDTLG